MPADYTFIIEEPPPRRRAGRRAGRHLTTELTDNLHRAAETPGTWARVATYDTDGTARTLASNLRQGRAAPRRPEGIWEFRSGDTEDGRFAVWAVLLP